MTVVLLRPLAEADLIERTRRYRDEGGEQLAARFFDAAAAALRAIQRMPRAGSLRIGELCALPGLRTVRVTGFPCGWFYFDRGDHLDVVRLLSYAQDLPALLADLDEP
ncbi:MAG: type II toxin-antitoxin system RelE/ParE family toxin [Acidimicrobiales bacterium]